MLSAGSMPPPSIAKEIASLYFPGRNAQYSRMQRKNIYALRSSCCSLNYEPEQPAPPFTDADTRDVVNILPPPPKLSQVDPRVSYNATALAFLGDAVWEIFVRRKYFSPPKNMAAYHRLVVDSVRAEKQAVHFENLMEGDFLQNQERQVLRWGRNATGGSAPKRFSKPQVTREVYRAATAVECLVGYLYLTDMNRLQQLMELCGLDCER